MKSKGKIRSHVVEGDYSAYPELLQALLPLFHGELCHLNYLWGLYETLFMGKEKTTLCCAKQLGGFMRLFENLLLESYVLNFCGLVDKNKNGNTHISLDEIVEACENEVSDLNRRIEDVYNPISGKHSTIREVGGQLIGNKEMKIPYILKLCGFSDINKRTDVNVPIDEFVKECKKDASAFTKEIKEGYNTLCDRVSYMRKMRDKLIAHKDKKTMTGDKPLAAVHLEYLRENLFELNSLVSQIEKYLALPEIDFWQASIGAFHTAQFLIDAAVKSEVYSKLVSDKILDQNHFKKEFKKWPLSEFTGGKQNA